MNIAEKRLPPPIPSPASFLYMYPNSVLYAVLLFVCYIVLLYLFTIMLLYVILILDCVGYFHRPKNRNTVPLHTYQRMFFASAIAATDKLRYA